MFEIHREKNFEPIGFNKQKTQIILTHSSRPIDNFLKSLEHRNFGKYNKINKERYIMLKETLKKDEIAAMKAREKAKVSVLRLVNSEIKAYEVNNREEANDDVVIKIVEKSIKQMFQDAGLD